MRATASVSPPRPSPVKVWFLAIRFFSFTTSTVPVLAASALALYEDSIDPIALVLMLIASMATHAGCNLANDYYDDQTGVDRKQVVGQGGALQRGWLTRRELGIGIVVSFAVALLAALPIMIDVGRPIILLAIASVAAAFFYTGGPFPLAYWALGEITVFLAMGVGMVAGTYYVHTGDVSLEPVLLGSSIGLMAAAILHANNIRDRDVDRAHHKRTLANLFSRGFADREFIVLLFVPWILVAALIARDPISWPLAVTVAALPRTVALMRAVAPARTVPELNRILRQSAGLHMRFGLLITAGYLTAAILDRWSS